MYLGLFKRRLGAARLPLSTLCDGKMRNISLPIASDESPDARLSLQVRWHFWSESEDIAGVPLSIHDVSASGLQDLPVEPQRDLKRMDDGMLVALLRAYGLRAEGSRKELLEKAKLVTELRRNDAKRLLKEVRDVVGRNNTLLLSNAVKNAASVLNTGMGMLKGDTMGALQTAMKV
mmetsp:Transcript_5760/g.8522  ORF Transcript_5760/g.8522 Transcript_5760/m.8522 type:complete len:176 (-) Transcript_5760:1671-2198(-)